MTFLFIFAKGDILTKDEINLLKRGETLIINNPLSPNNGNSLIFHSIKHRTMLLVRSDESKEKREYSYKSLERLKEKEIPNGNIPV